MQPTLQLLQLLTEAYPPPPDQNHAVLVGPRPGTLTVAVWIPKWPGPCHITLDPEDLGKDPAELLQGIQGLLPSPSR